MNGVYLAIVTFVVLCGLSAVAALVWSIRSGAFSNFDAAARSILTDDEDPAFVDIFPGAPVIEPASPHGAGGTP